MPRTYAWSVALSYCILYTYLHFFYSSEAVVSLILHDFEKIPRGSWSLPTWLPNRYLTWNRSEVPL